LEEHDLDGEKTIAPSKPKSVNVDEIKANALDTKQDEKKVIDHMDDDEADVNQSEFSKENITES